jgi:hypothetical protein
VWVAALTSAPACGDRLTGPSDAVRFDFDFRRGLHDWTAEFSDYSVLIDRNRMMLDWGFRPLPDAVGGGSALFIQGDNLSEDLFMFFKRRVDGLNPATTYAAAFEVQFATGVPYGCFGIGDSPGEGVHVKAGASASEPAVVIINGRYQVALDKGNQATGGREAVALGDIASSVSGNAVGCQFWTHWELKTLRSGAGAVVVKPDASGSVWLVFGTESGFGGVTRLYYIRFVAELSPQ